MAKFCPNCGKELMEGADICTNCGKVLNKSNSQNNIEDLDKKANTGFILGLVSIIAWILPIAGYPVTICGIVFCSKGLKSSNNKTKAIIGLVLSIIFLLATLTNSVLGVLDTVA